jgi:hypothetical protein
MTVKVIRTQSATLLPRAQCLGDDPDLDAPSNCPYVLGHNRRALAIIKSHIKTHPTHQILVIHETRSIYEASQ